MCLFAAYLLWTEASLPSEGQMVELEACIVHIITFL